MHVHRLNTNAPWGGEAVKYQLPGTGKNPRRQTLELRVHGHSPVLVNPSPGLYVNLLSRLKDNLKHIPIAMYPDDAVIMVGNKLINEESSSSHEHVGNALHAGEGVVHMRGCGQELVLPHLNALTAFQVDTEYMACSIPAEGDASRAARLGHEHRHPGKNSLECSGQRLYSDHNGRIFPQQYVMFKVDRYGSQLDVKRGNELTFNVIGYASEGFITDICVKARQEQALGYSFRSGFAGR